MHRLNAFRRIRYAVTLLLIIMALFVTTESAFLAYVHAAPTVTPIPTHAIPGTLITVTLAGFDITDTSCTISGTPVASGSASTCTLVGGMGSLTFPVKQYAPAGTYTLTVTGNTKSDTGQASFTVDGFNLVLSAGSGATGIEVTFTMKNVPTYDTSCSVSGQPSGVVTIPGCAVSSGVGNGTFIVGNVPPGDYVIEVTACTGNNGCPPSQGDYAQQVFTVTGSRGPYIQLTGINGGFVSVGKAAKGPVGTHVTVSGGNFAATDTSCTLSSTSNGAVIVNGACSTFTTSAGGQNVTGSFVVGNVQEGQYVIQVTGSTGDFAQAVFNVTAGAFIQLGVNGIIAPLGQIASGVTGTHVTIEGSNFLPQDANSGTCTVSSPTSGNVIASGSAGCSFFKAASGFANVTGSFVIGNIAEGQYVIQVSGSAGDRAQAVLNVTAGAFIQLGVNGIIAPLGQIASGVTGTHVTIEGSSFLPQDANSGTCTVSSPSSGTVIASGSAACSFFKASNGFVNATGSFVVGNVAEGQYVIQVSGSSGDRAQAIFNVTAGAFIQLSGQNGGFVSLGQVASGPTGLHVSIEGSNFLPQDANSGTCTVSSPSSGTVIASGSAACSFFKASNGFANATGSFVIGNIAEGQYVIQVSGSAGDRAQAVLNVTAGAFIQLGVNGIIAPLGQIASGATGTHVTIEGSSFLPQDANSGTCTVSSPTSGSVIASGSAACSFFKASNGFVNATGSFVVGNVYPGQYVIQVSGSSGDRAQAIFNVTAGAFIQLSSGPPGGFVSLGQVAMGPIGTHVAVEGSNFLPGDTSCTLSSPTGAIVIGAACSTFTAGNGFKNVTGSFTVGNVLPGQYVIQVTGSGGDFAQSVFNVTVGAHLTLSPGSGRIGTHVLVNGTGFLPTDHSCIISSSSGAFILAGSAACAVQLGTGQTGGSFTVGNIAPGQYLVQVTGNQGDFAQAVFNVTVGPKLSLSPGSGPVGVHVLVNGTGFLPTDNTCTITGPGSTIVIASGCSIQAGTGAPGGSFTAGNVVPGQYVIQVTGSGGDFAQAVFNVTQGAAVVLYPIES